MGQTSRVEFLDVLRQERDDIAERRRAAGLAATDSAQTGSVMSQNVGPVTGLALSGGGIRSASVGLGFLQALYRRGVLGQIDYLSTVSGGGYAGSYLSSTITAAPRKIDWGPSRPDEKLPVDKQRLQFEAEATGKQPDAVREVAGQGKSLGRPIRFLSRQLWGFLTINLFVVSGLVAIVALLAWLFRLLDAPDTVVYLSHLGFNTDVERAFFPAVVLLFVFLAVQILTALLRARRRRVPEFGTVMYLLLVAAAVMGVVSLFATGDVDIRGFEVHYGLSPTIHDRVGVVLGWLGKIAAFVLTASIIPWLRPSLLLRSGTKPRNVVEGWTFNVFSHALVLGVPLLLFWFFVQEDISRYNVNRADRFTFSRVSFPRLADFSSMLWQHTLGQPTGRGPSARLREAMPDRLEGDALTGGGSSGMRLALLQREIDRRDGLTWWFQPWVPGLSPDRAEVRADDLADRRRLRTWKDQFAAAWSAEILSDPEFHEAFAAEKLAVNVVARDAAAGTIGAAASQNPGSPVERSYQEWLDSRAPAWWTPRRGAGREFKVRDLLRHAAELQHSVDRYRDIIFARAAAQDDPALQEVDADLIATNGEWLLRRLALLERISEDLRKKEPETDSESLAAHLEWAATIRTYLQTTADFTNDVRQTNWALLEAYYGTNHLRPPTTVFATVVNARDQEWRLRVSGVSALIFVLAGLLVHVNPTTLHSFYRDQLAPMWIVPRDQRHPLRDLDTCGRGGPYHVLGGTINLFGRKRDRELEPTSRFIFTRRFCGGERVGYCPTGQYARGKYDLADAMAVSGGAVSPTQIDNLLVRVILMLFNLRLGQWLPNPSRPPSDVSWPSWLSLFWGFLFWKPEDRAYCFVTDGGHLENTGIAALLRRRCRVIVALDASQDGGSQFLDFNKVLQTARSQYGVRITALTMDGETGRWEEINLAPVRSMPARRADGGQGSSEAQGTKPAPAPGTATRAERHFLVARIEYPDNEQTRAAGMTGPRQQVGYLVYVKPTLTGDEPPQVLGFDAVSAEFPHDSTLDQLFDAARFDAYRALGEHLGDVVATELEGQAPPAGRESTAWLADWSPGAAQRDAAPVAVAPTSPSPSPGPPDAALGPRDVNADFEAQVERALAGLRAEDETTRQHACVALDYWLSEQIAPAELLVRVIQEIMLAFGSAKDPATREQYCLTLIRMGEKRQSVRDFLAKRAADPDESDAVRFLCREHVEVES